MLRRTMTTLLLTLPLIVSAAGQKVVDIEVTGIT